MTNRGTFANRANANIIYRAAKPVKTIQADSVKAATPVGETRISS